MVKPCLTIRINQRTLPSLIVAILVILAGAIRYFRNKPALSDSQPDPTEFATTTLDLNTLTSTSTVDNNQEGTLSVTPFASTPLVDSSQEGSLSIPATLQSSSMSTKPSPSINPIQSRFFLVVRDEFTQKFEPRTPLPQNGQLFPASLDEAEALAGFKILEPTFLPDGYVLRAMDYSAEDQHVGLLYYIPSNDQSPQIYFLQQHIAFSDHQSIVGASAVIQEFQVNDTPAEYVQGGFDDAGSTPTVDRLRWNPFRDLGRFRWVRDNIYFQISTGTEIDTTSLQLMAESLKQHVAAPDATPLPTLMFEEAPSG